MTQPYPLQEFGRAETIAERKARLDYDKRHPWTPVSEAVIDGTVCELLFNDMAGNFDGGNRRFVFVKENRWGFQRWVCINDRYAPSCRPCGFRPTDQVLSMSELMTYARRAGV